MANIDNKVDELEEIFGNIDGIIGVMEKDLIIKGSDVEVEALSDFDISCLLSAIKSFTQRGNYLLDGIDTINKQVNR